MNRKFTLIVLSFLLFCSLNSFSQWIRTSSQKGENITSLYYDGNIMYAIGGKVLYKFVNNKWESIYHYVGFDSDSLTAIYKTNNTLFLGTTTQDLYRSSDNGLTWEYFNTKNGWVMNGFINYADKLFIARENSVYYSEDNGSTWQGGGNSPYTNTIIEYAKQLIIGTKTSGVKISKDTSKTWIASNSGIGIKNITSFAYKNKYLFCSAFGVGVYLSTDTTKNWKAVNSNLYNFNVNKLTIFHDTLFASTTDSLYYATNFENVIWTSVKVPTTSNGIITMTDNGTELFFGNKFGVYRWENSLLKYFNNGFTRYGANYMFNYNDTLFVNTGNAVYSYIDLKDSFAIDKRFPNNSVSGFQKMRDTMYLVVNANGLYKSSPACYNWKKISTKQPTSIAFVKSTILFSSGSEGVYRSLDFGKKWILVNNGLTSNTIIDIAFLDTVAYVIDNYNNIYTSTNYGDLWVKVKNPFPTIDFHKFYKSGNNLYMLSTYGIDFYKINGTVITLIKNEFITDSQWSGDAAIVGDAMLYKNHHVISMNNYSGPYSSARFSLGINIFDTISNSWYRINKGLKDSLFSAKSIFLYPRWPIVTKLLSIENKNQIFAIFENKELWKRDLSTYVAPQPPLNFVCNQIDSSSWNFKYSFKYDSPSQNFNGFLLTMTGSDSSRFNLVGSNLTNSDIIMYNYKTQIRVKPSLFQLFASNGWDLSAPVYAGKFFTDIKETKEDLTIDIYPNPVVNDVYLKTRKINCFINSIEVFNINGKLILFIDNLKEKESKINFTNYSNGMYLIKIKLTEGYFYKKIIKE